MIQINDKSHCCGCTACVQRCPKQCITLSEDEEGFLYPKVDVTNCIECGLCEKVCPVLHQGTPKFPDVCYAAINPNEKVRKESSSGGIFTAIASAVLKEGGVVFGARFDTDWSVMHDYTETYEGLAAFRGSKYLQSRIGNSFRQTEDFLKSGRKVLFTGTPCQIAGLRRYLRKDYPNLLAMDFICHGVPSPLVWQQYLQGIRKKHSDIKISQIYFRDKTVGWKKFSLTINQIKKQEEITVLSEPFPQNIYMQGFLKDIYLRPSCYSCAAKSMKSGSDLTIGDFWGIGRYGKPFKHDTMKGVSLVLANTTQGEAALQELKDCFVEERTLEEALIENHNLKSVSVLNPYRKSIISDFLNPDISLQAIATKYKLVDRSMKARVKTVATRLGLFSIVKRMYNWYKIKSYGKA